MPRLVSSLKVGSLGLCLVTGVRSKSSLDEGETVPKAGFTSIWGGFLLILKIWSLLGGGTSDIPNMSH